jgi:hypothetical protein
MGSIIGNELFKRSSYGAEASLKKMETPIGEFASF